MGLLPARYLSVSFAADRDPLGISQLTALTVVDAYPLPPTAGAGYRIDTVQQFVSGDSPLPLLAVWDLQWDHSPIAATLVATREEQQDLALLRFAESLRFLAATDDPLHRVLIWEQDTQITSSRLTLAAIHAALARLAGDQVALPALDVTCLLQRCLLALLIDAATAEAWPNSAHRHAYRNSLRSLQKSDHLKKVQSPHKNMLRTKCEHDSLSASDVKTAIAVLQTKSNRFD